MIASRILTGGRAETSGTHVTDRWRTSVLLACGALTLAAAACLPRSRPLTDVPMDETWVYSCPADFRFSARLMNEVVSLRLPDRTTAVPRVGSSAGTRYRAEALDFTRNGASATLQADGRTHADCTGQRAETAWDVARMLGAEFRAVGVEPAWSLEIDDGQRMRFLIEGSSEVIAPTPEATRNGTSTSYRATSVGHAISVTIDAQPCTVAVLGPGLTHTVTLTVDGFPYVGCGRVVGSGTGS